MQIPGYTRIIWRKICHCSVCSVSVSSPSLHFLHKKCSPISIMSAYSLTHIYFAFVFMVSFLKANVCSTYLKNRGIGVKISVNTVCTVGESYFSPSTNFINTNMVWTVLAEMERVTAGNDFLSFILLC